MLKTSMIGSLVFFLGSSASGQEKNETSPKTPAAPYPIPPDAVQQSGVACENAVSQMVHRTE